MSQTRCATCGATASGTHDPATDRWYCLDCSPPRLLVGAPRTGESPRALAGVMGGMNAVMCHAPDGERIPEGGEPWHWAPQGRQAVTCKGFAIPAKGVGHRLLRERSEDQAQRETLQRALAAVGGDVQRLQPDQLAAALKLSERQARRRKEKRGRRRAA